MYIIQPRAYGLDTTKQQQKQIYRLHNVCVGYVLYRALVISVICPSYMYIHMYMCTIMIMFTS